MEHAFDPSTQEAKAGGSLGVSSQPGLQTARAVITEKPCLERKKDEVIHQPLRKCPVLTED